MQRINQQPQTLERDIHRILLYIIIISWYSIYISRMIYIYLSEHDLNQSISKRLGIILAKFGVLELCRKNRKLTFRWSKPTILTIYYLLEMLRTGWNACQHPDQYIDLPTAAHYSGVVTDRTHASCIERSERYACRDLNRQQVHACILDAYMLEKFASRDRYYACVQLHYGINE